MSKANVVKVDVGAFVDCEQLGGLEKLGVHEVTVMLGVDAIPSVVLACAPSEGLVPDPLKPKVFKPTISDFSNMYRKLSAAAEGLNATGSVSITVYYSDRESDSIFLTDWILSEVGMSGISANSAPYLTIVLQHPICRLTKVGSVYEEARSYENLLTNESTKKAKDILQIMSSVYSCVNGSNQSSINYWPVPGLPTVFRSSIGQGIYDPRNYLEFKADTEKGEQGIFLGGRAVTNGPTGKGILERLAQAIGDTILPTSNGSSTWDMLLRSAGSIMLSVTQDQENNYTGEKLVIEPKKPWKKAAITLDQEHCSMTEIPGMDPFKISGVLARKIGVFCDYVSTWELKNGNPNQENPVSSEIYIPVPSPDLSSGRVMKTSAPMVLNSALRRDGQYGVDLGMAKAKLLELRKNYFNDVLKQYCKAVYELSVRSMVQAGASMVLAFRDLNGKLILPGNTCVFKSGDEAIYYGYAVSVTHHWSASGGCATNVKMSYVRPEEDFKIGNQTIIAAGSPNAAYV